MAIKNINIPLTDEEYEILVEVKEEKTWREFLLSLLPVKPQTKEVDEE